MSFFNMLQNKLKLNSLTLVAAVILMGTSPAGFAHMHCVTHRSHGSVSTNCSGPLSPRAARDMARATGSMVCGMFRMQANMFRFAMGRKPIHWKRRCWYPHHHHHW